MRFQIIKTKTNTSLAWIAAICVSIIWGLTPVLSKPFAGLTSSIVIIFIRYVIALIGLFIIFLITYKINSVKKELGYSLKIDKKDILKLILCGIVGQGGYAFFGFEAILHIGATENGLIFGMLPFAIVFFGISFQNYKMYCNG